MSNIIELVPGSTIITEPATEDDTDKLHAQAFCDMEGAICDCLRMATITRMIMADETDERLIFAVHRTEEMLEKLKADYYAAWEGERTGPS